MSRKQDEHHNHTCPQGALKQLLKHSMIQMSAGLCVITTDPKAAHLQTNTLQRQVVERLSKTSIYCPLKVEFEIGPIAVKLASFAERGTEGFD